MTQLTQLQNFITALDLPKELEELLSQTIDQYQHPTDSAQARLQTELEAQEQELERTGDPPTKTLWEKAHLVGFANIFADLMEHGRGNGENISPLQAFFCGWYSIYIRQGGRDLLKMVDLPTSVTGIAAYLNRERQTLYNWMAAEWFTELGVDSWVNRGLMEIIPDAVKRLHQNVLYGSGPTSNAAIKITFDTQRQKKQTEETEDLANDWWAASED